MSVFETLKQKFPGRNWACMDDYILDAPRSLDDEAKIEVHVRWWAGEDYETFRLCESEIRKESADEKELA